MPAKRLFFLALNAVTLLLVAHNGVEAISTPEKRAPSSSHWVDTWTTMPQLTESANLPPPPFNQTGLVFPNSTIRQTLHMSVGAEQIRLRISNAFGVTDLPITAVTIALPVNGSAGVSAIQKGTLKTVTFSGDQSVDIPNGALVVSDPINFSIEPQSMITTTNSITSHPGSRTTSWFSFGNFVSAENLTDPSTQNVAHWFFLSAVEALVPVTSGALAIVGDSITDGRGSTTDANNRWPDLVLEKMQKNPATKNIAVVNQAAGGNRILADGLGPNAFGRIERDVLAQSGIKYAMIFEGVNDIGTADATTAAQQAIGDRLIWAFKQIVTRLKTAGLPVFAATITPFSGDPTIQPYSSPVREATRQRVNTFIRTSDVFDAVIDLIKSQLNPKFDSGDFLHPNVAGYQAIADAFPLNIFN
ncbi:SGNH hydrolase-type esterase domain-containing protein [Flammula alnicola]|nr:SGNH hydrolase-type esterase domain-containing protein [Flammula alnicola]